MMVDCRLKTTYKTPSAIWRLWGKHHGRQRTMIHVFILVDLQRSVERDSVLESTRELLFQKKAMED
jgi:hypothetical protein